MFWKKFQVSGSDKTPFPEVTKLRFFIYKVPFILHQLVKLFHNSTNAKEPKKIGQVKKSVKVSFSLLEHKKGR